MYNFCQIDPAAPPALNPLMLGVEVTIPAIAQLCGLGNIDPQHNISAGADEPAAISESLGWPLPPPGACLATIRTDIDALGAMAVLSLRAEGVEPDSGMQSRIARVDKADRFEKGVWPGKIPLPDTLADLLGDPGSAEISALSAVSFNRSKAISARVEIVKRWLMTGQIPAEYFDIRRKRGEVLLHSFRAGATRVESVFEGHIAIVVSLEFDVLRLGYRLAPVVVALNPAFLFADGKRGRKFTIAQYSDAHVNLRNVAIELSGSEAGWGGAVTIIGSPQDQPSKLCLDPVWQAVTKELIA